MNFHLMPCCCHGNVLSSGWLFPKMGINFDAFITSFVYCYRQNTWNQHMTNQERCEKTNQRDEVTAQFTINTIIFWYRISDNSFNHNTNRFHISVTTMKIGINILRSLSLQLTIKRRRCGWLMTIIVLLGNSRFLYCICFTVFFYVMGL